MFTTVSYVYHLRRRHGIVEALVVLQGLDGLVQGGGEALFSEEGEHLLLVVPLEGFDVTGQHEERCLEVVGHHGVLVQTLRPIGGRPQLDHPVCRVTGGRQLLELLTPPPTSPPIPHTHRVLVSRINSLTRPSGP